MRILILASFLPFVSLLNYPAFADDLATAIAAYNHQDFTTALRLLKPLAEHGNAEAQTDLGLYYSDGAAAKADNVTAARWFLAAARQGYPAAEYNLGYSYYNGFGVPRDQRQAVRWEMAAARQGFPAAENWIGVQFSQGTGAPKDLVRAYMWLTLAAEAGGDDGDLAKNNRDSFPITDAQAAVAKSLATLCKSSRFKNCGDSYGQTVHAVVIHVPLRNANGTLTVPVSINSTITLGFTLDSGAADVSIPADVVSTLMRTGTLKASDFNGAKSYVLADGAIIPSATFIIRSLKVGDYVAKNIQGSVSPSQAPLLLGQSFLQRFNAWSIDNNKNELVLQ
jgi:hypothetical protein